MNENEPMTIEEIEELGDIQEAEIEEKQEKAQKSVKGKGSGKRYVEMYKELHRNPKRFPGNSLSAYVEEITELVKQYEAKTLLDYGSGKGYQYLGRREHEKWGGVLPTCYDPGVPSLDTLPPEGTKFDGVICTDVLEHIPRHDVPEFIERLFYYANKFVFMSVATFPSNKELPNGENCHITIKPVSWWREQIEAVADKPYVLEVNTKRSRT